jgi:RNA ligase (TIGR02306 family)
MESNPPEQTSESDFFKKRKLASVQKITSLTPLGDKNLFQKATILGWNVMVDNGKYSIDEKVIYFEADALLPSKKKWTKGIKPKQLRAKSYSAYNIIFHGFIMKLDTLLNVEKFNLKLEDLNEGFDLTEIMEVTKYEEDPEQALKEKEKKFPSDIIEKSDEIRLQSNPKYFQIFEGKEFYSTLKYDGSSGTFLIHPVTKKFLVCSRNQIIDINEKKNIYWDTANKYDIKTKLEKFEGKYAIQGEIYGPKINKNRLDQKEIKLAVFTIKNIIDNYYLDFKELVQVCKDMDLPMVEVVEEGVFKYKTVEEMVEKSKGLYPGTNYPREGIVYRLKENWNKDKIRASFKVINDDYLVNTK